MGGRKSLERLRIKPTGSKVTENDGAVTRQGTSRCMRSEIGESIDIFDLARITHVVSMWALGEVVTQVGHGYVGPILREVGAVTPM